MTEHETVQVTQADGDAAMAYEHAIRDGTTMPYAPTHYLGDKHPLPQAFARHRLAHSVSRDEVIERAAAADDTAPQGDFAAAFVHLWSAAFDAAPDHSPPPLTGNDMAEAISSLETMIHLRASRSPAIVQMRQWLSCITALLAEKERLERVLRRLGDDTRMQQEGYARELWLRIDFARAALSQSQEPVEL